MSSSATSDINDLIRQLPSVDAVLLAGKGIVAEYGHLEVTKKIRDALDAVREQILTGDILQASSEHITSQVLADVQSSLEEQSASSLIPVFNLTGTILHTNLGRAMLPESAVQAVVRVAASPVNLEYDLEAGQRGERDTHAEALVCQLTGAQAATFVNNNAAAVLLVLNTLAQNREVPVSRGELVEIGGSFRIPEVMERSGCKLVEVGATNRTHLKDYKKAINSNTAMLLKVHTSNYRIEGFTAEVSETELAELAHQVELPFVIDMGSGCLLDLTAYDLPKEQTAAQAIESGADIITFSGDKLLGGPQCGIIAGKSELVEAIRSNPLKRALRLDKMTLAALVEVLKLYRNPEALVQALPTLRIFTRPLKDIREVADRLSGALVKALSEQFLITTETGTCQAGSGALPVKILSSIAVVIASADKDDESIRRLEQKFRKLPRPVIGRINKGRLLLDMRCLEAGIQEKEFIAQLATLAASLADAATEQ
ncbi:MAG: L-seryl-tRNA(Sec) selenium transferase [Gammaproteobacteria bacterium]|nr:L-seryl-tRNA(Sec) selenium transferase [Gammaproteobacteria bacterium]